MNFKLLFYSWAKKFGGYFEKVFHAGLWIHWMNIFVAPYLIYNISNVIDEGSDLSKFECINFRDLGRHSLKILINNCRVFPQRFIRILTNVFSLILKPTLDLVLWTENTSELVNVKISLLQTVTPFAYGFL